MEDTFGIVRKGLSPGDSDRFVKLWWEIDQSQLGIGATWSPYANGGNFSPYFRDPQEVVLWSDTGREMKGYCFADGRPRYVIRSQDLYGTPGLTFGKRGEILNVQVLPSGCVFSNEGYLILPKPEVSQWVLLAYLNSDFARYIVNMVCGLHKEVGAIKLVPVPVQLFAECRIQLEASAKLGFSSVFVLNADEIEPRANYPFWWREKTDSLLDLSRRWRRQSQELADNANTVVHQVNADIRSVAFPDIFLDIEAPEFRPTDEGDEVSKRVFSLIVGQVFGRWDIRFVTGERDTPDIPDPFSYLPTCPPGMLQNAAGLPATPADVPADYPLRISWPGILVDDETNKEDIVGRVREALAVIWPETHDAIEQEACQILGVATLRDYFASPNRFFDDHLKRYSKSRRQAPIYWPLSTPSGSYTLWLYYHRLTDQTLYSCVNDFVEPKLAECSRQMADLRRLGQRSAAQERELEKLVNLTRELEEFRAELLRLAPLWKPNLNDGVQITAAPLWRLFQHRAWQKRLRETWEKLEAGEYDWAHLAYSLWSARVREKCRADKSLAIAHGLEAVYVEPPAGKKGKGRKKATAEQEEMFDE